MSPRGVIVDRCSDVVWVLAAVAVGCPLELALAVVCGVFLLEYLRARAGNAGFGEVGTVTVAERWLHLGLWNDCFTAALERVRPIDETGN